MIRERPSQSARERIVGAAATLFYQRGIRAVGVDTLIDAAGVAKATFYHHFPSKDDLVVAWLKDAHARWFDRVRIEAEARAAGFAERVIPSFFDVVTEWFAEDGFRGCPYLIAAIELPDPEHPARAVIRDYTWEIEHYFRAALARAGYREAVTLAPKLFGLLAGAFASAATRNSPEAASIARDAALLLLHRSELAERRPPRRSYGAIPADQ